MIAAGVCVCGSGRTQCSCLLILLLLLLLMMLLPLLLLLLIMMMLLLMLLMLMMLQMVLLLLLQCALLPAPLLQLIMICNQLSIPSPAGPTLPRPSRLLPPSSANFWSLSNYNLWQQCLPQDMPEMQATAAAAGAAAAPDAARLLTLADDMRHLCDNVFTCDGAQSACMLR